MKQVNEEKQRDCNWILTITLALSMLLASLGTSIANIALPTLAKYFAAPFAAVQPVVVGYLTALTTGVLVAGRMGDRFGLKSTLVAGLLIFAVASAGCALATDLTWLVYARVVQGFGAAFLMTLSMALMRQMAHAERIGRAMGILGTVSAIGTALGPSLGGLLIPVYGWRSLFWIQVPAAVLAIAMVASLVPNIQDKETPKAVRFASVLNQSLVASLAINLLVATVMMTTLVVGPFYLSLGLGLKPAQVGLVMTIGPVISIVSGIPSGRIVDLWGSGKVLTIGLALLGSGSILLVVLPAWLGITAYVAPIALLTVGYQLFQAANNTAVLADAPASVRGTISAVLNLSRNLGLIGGASLMGAAFAVGVGTHEIVAANPSAIEEGMRWTFLLASALIVVAIGLRLALREPIRGQLDF